MKKLFFLFAAFFAMSTAHAQFSVQETDGSSRFRLLGKTWNPNFFSLASAETDKMENGGRLSTYNYLTLATYVGDSYRLGFRLPFQYNTAGTDRFNREKVNDQELFLQDIIVSLQKYDLMYLPWDLGVYWEGRAYLPTSKNSKQSGLITRLRNNFIVSKVLNRHFELEYDNKFSYYFQSRSTYRNTFEDEDGYEVNAVSSTKQMSLDHRLSLWGKITPQAGLGWQVGGEDDYWNKSDAENKSKPGERMIKTGPAARFPLGDNMNFILTYEDKVNRDDNMKEFGKFRAENTQFTLLSFVRF